MLAQQDVNCGEMSVDIALLGLLHIVKDAFETWPFQQEPC